MLATSGCGGGSEDGSGPSTTAAPGDSGQSGPSTSGPSAQVVGATEADNQPGRYHWEGDDLYVADGTAIQLLGDSMVPVHVYAEGSTLDLRFATVLSHDATITFDGLDTDSVEIALPRNFNFVVTYDGFETTMKYDGCWGGNCIGGLQYSLSGSGKDEVFDSGSPNQVTFNFTNGTSSSVRIYNLETAQVETDPGTDRTVITLTADILFEFGQSTLTPGAREEIADIADQIPQGAQVTVDGHTDSISGDDINVPLSEARAKTVADVLREVRPDLTLTEAGHSSHEPVAANQNADGTDNPAGRALNRRVEISFPSS